MLVRLKRDWFGPTEVINVGGGGPRGLNGRIYARGVQEMPDELRPLLPRDARVLGEDPKAVPEPAPAPVPEPTLKDFDAERTYQEALAATEQTTEAPAAPAEQQAVAVPAPTAVAGGARKPRAGG